jgi:hypothetical protein
MVTVASIYLRFYIEVGVGTFLPTPTPTPPKINSDSDSTALDHTMLLDVTSRSYVILSKFLNLLVHYLSKL